MSFSLNSLRILRSSFFKCAISTAMSNNLMNSSKRTIAERPINQLANKIRRLNGSDKFKVKYLNSSYEFLNTNKDKFLKVMDIPDKPEKDRKDYR